MKLWEAVVREPGPDTEEKRVRIGASSAYDCKNSTGQGQCLICLDKFLNK